MLFNACAPPIITDPNFVFVTLFRFNSFGLHLRFNSLIVCHYYFALFSAVLPLHICHSKIRLFFVFIFFVVSLFYNYYLTICCFFGLWCLRFIAFSTTKFCTWCVCVCYVYAALCLFIFLFVGVLVLCYLLLDCRMLRYEFELRYLVHLCQPCNTEFVDSKVHLTASVLI